MTDRIDHAAEAVSALVGGSHVRAEAIGRAQVHATLAVAEQLRVLNAKGVVKVEITTPVSEEEVKKRFKVAAF